MYNRELMKLLRVLKQAVSNRFEGCFLAGHGRAKGPKGIELHRFASAVTYVRVSRRTFIVTFFLVTSKSCVYTRAAILPASGTLTIINQRGRRLEETYYKERTDSN